MNAEITHLLAEVQAGNAEATSRLASLVYAELHNIAVRHMRREGPDNSLQATLLVDEAFMRLVGQRDRSWENRSHFFALAAQMMRRILIDHARGRRTRKRGGGQQNVDFEDAIIISDDNCEDVLAVDEALNRLAGFDPRLARVVELKFFAGLTVEEIGAVIGISSRTVKREWRVAKAWLEGELASGQRR